MNIYLKFKSCVASSLIASSLMMVPLLIGCGQNDNELTKESVEENVPENLRGKYRGATEDLIYNIHIQDNNTFILEARANTNSPASLTAEGTHQKLSSGFLGFTVTSSSGPNALPEGRVIYGLELPGDLFFMSLSGAVLVPMIAEDTCPETEVTFNWILARATATAKSRSTLNLSSYGLMDYSSATESFTHRFKYRLSDHRITGTNETINMNSCSNGLLSLPNKATAFLTTSGIGLVKDNKKGVLLASPINSITLRDLEGSYLGAIIDERKGVTVPIQLNVSNTLGLTNGVAQSIVDLESGETGNFFPIIFDSPNQPQDGFFKIASLGKNLTSLLKTMCYLSQNIGHSRRDMIFCVGASSENKLWNVVLISQ